MKIMLILLFAVTMLLCSCGENSLDTSNENEDPEVVVNDETPTGSEEEPAIAGTSITQAFETHTISLIVPEGWNSLIISESEMFDFQHTGIQLFDGEIPEQPEMYDGKLYVAIAASGFAKTHVDNWIDMGTEFTEKAYTTKAGYAIKLYYVDGLLEYATFDDYSEMCVFFDLSEDDDIDEILGIVDSIEFDKAE